MRHQNYAYRYRSDRDDESGEGCWCKPAGAPRALRISLFGSALGHNGTRCQGTVRFRWLTLGRQRARKSPTRRGSVSGLCAELTAARGPPLFTSDAGENSLVPKPAGLFGAIEPAGLIALQAAHRKFLKIRFDAFVAIHGLRHVHFSGGETEPARSSFSAIRRHTETRRPDMSRSQAAPRTIRATKIIRHRAGCAQPQFDHICWRPPTSFAKAYRRKLIDLQCLARRIGGCGRGHSI